MYLARWNSFIKSFPLCDNKVMAELFKIVLFWELLRCLIAARTTHQNSQSKDLAILCGKNYVIRRFRFQFLIRDPLNLILEIMLIKVIMAHSQKNTACIVIPIKKWNNIFLIPHPVKENSHWLPMPS